MLFLDADSGGQTAIFRLDIVRRFYSLWVVYYPHLLSFLSLPSYTVAGFVEWVLTYLLVAKDGIVYKDDLRKVYDGSIFFEIAGRKDGHY